MTTISRNTSLRALGNRAWALSPALTLGAGAMFLGALLSVLGMVLDSRQLLGEPLWLKPAKFYFSLGLYDVTLLYFLAFLPEHGRKTRILGAILSLCGVLEMVAITLQAARGVRSHFNITSLFDMVIYQSMGITITVLWVTMMVLGVMLLRAKLEERPLASALRMGVVVAVVGMGVGYFMTSPHGAQQMAALKAGQKPPEAGGHTFGGTDGGHGLPLVGWSVTAGDMRPAHFLGLHGMQVLPLVALLLSRRRVRSESSELAVVRGVGVAYLGLTLTLALQALRGLPIVEWDATGHASLALVLVASGLTFAASLVRRKEPAHSVA